jgi:DNA polymerase-3 subunit beta
MKLKINRDRLIEPLSLISGVVEKRQTLPILGNVLIQEKAGQLKLTGTDSETEIHITLDSVDGSAGETTVAARKFMDICRSLPDQATIELEQKDQRLRVKSGRSVFTLQTLPAGDFPSIETQDWDIHARIKHSDLKRGIRATWFAMAQQDVRFYLNGLLLEFRSDGLKSIATDGHRLAKSETTCKTAIEGTRQCIVPRKSVIEMNRLLQDSEDLAELKIGPNHIRLIAGNVTFTSKLIDGRFPDYERVIPKKLEHSILINRETLIDIVKRVSILTNEKFRGIRLVLKPGTLTVLASNPEQEEATDEIEIDYAGPEMEIGFNATYLSDAMEALSSETVEIDLQDTTSSCVVKAPKANDTIYVLMPLRL